jgi:hypothetical protein
VNCIGVERGNKTAVEGQLDSWPHGRLYGKSGCAPGARARRARPNGAGPDSSMRPRRLVLDTLQPTQHALGPSTQPWPWPWPTRFTTAPLGFRPFPSGHGQRTPVPSARQPPSQGTGAARPARRCIPPRRLALARPRPPPSSLPTAACHVRAAAQLANEAANHPRTQARPPSSSAPTASPDSRRAAVTLCPLSLAARNICVS